MKVMRTDDEEKLMAAQNEFNLLKDAKHMNVVEFKETFFDSMRNTVYTVMEYFESVTL